MVFVLLSVALPPRNSTVAEILNGYPVMRDQARACRSE
jgi:hypothetical protein